MSSVSSNGKDIIYLVGTKTTAAKGIGFTRAEMSGVEAENTCTRFLFHKLVLKKKCSVYINGKYIR